MALPEGFPTLSLPVRPPYPRMEALAVGELPVGEGWLYESQWAGFRCLAFREGGQVVLQSKSAQPLTPYVPELVAALSARRAERFAVDGEIVVATYGRLDFDALLQRIHPAESRVRRFARETPVTYLLFDALVDDQGQDLTALPLAGRRQRLQALVERWPADERFRLSPAAPDRGRAARWLAELGGAGLDSVVAKRADAAYAAGDRTAMRKVKRAPMADRVVVGFRYAQTGGEVGSRLLGLYDDEGLLHHIGFSASFSVPERRRLKPLVEPLVQAPGFTGSAPGGPGRWRARRNTEWQPLEPRLVCEVRYDHFSGRRFRHGAKFLRWRPDKAPRLCTFAQVAGGPDRGLEEFWSRQRTG